MNNAILSILYFLDAFLGLSAGLFLGSIIRSRQEETKENLYYHHPGIENRSEQTGSDSGSSGKKEIKRCPNRKALRSHPEQKQKTTESILTDDCSRDPGYTGISCSDLTKDSTELIKKMRHRQDRKYLFARMEKTRKQKKTADQVND